MKLTKEYRRMDKKNRSLFMAGALALSTVAFADDDKQNGEASCKSNALPSHALLRAALIAATGNPPSGNGGFNLPMWATVVDRTGTVCQVAFSGDRLGVQFPGSRVISAEKANTANQFSIPTLALSTANLYTGVQPGGGLFGLQESNPVDVKVAYKGPADKWGSARDPMRGGRVGGVVVFGGGLALYDTGGQVVGGIGVSGDSSCADHNIAWKLRHALNLDTVPGGISNSGDDNIVYTPGPGNAGFVHPECSPTSTASNPRIGR
jgi:uncharacterized protein GlcG (DUF336 family)